MREKVYYEGEDVGLPAAYYEPVDAAIERHVTPLSTFWHTNYFYVLTKSFVTF